MVKVAASATGAKFYEISMSTLLKKHIGEGEAAVALLFNMAKLDERAIIFFDEGEQFLGKRDTGKDNNNTAGITSAIMMEMQQLTRRDKVMVVVATNAPWNIDNGVHSRISKSIYVPLPGKLFIITYIVGIT